MYSLLHIFQNHHQVAQIGVFAGTNLAPGGSCLTHPPFCVTFSNNLKYNLLPKIHFKLH